MHTSKRCKDIIWMISMMSTYHIKEFHEINKYNRELDHKLRKDQNKMESKPLRSNSSNK
jgi:hypothetical protein